MTATLLAASRNDADLRCTCAKRIKLGTYAGDYLCVEHDHRRMLIPTGGIVVCPDHHCRREHLVEPARYAQARAILARARLQGLLPAL